MNKRADKVETAGSRLAVIGAQAMVETLVEITPVDTSEHLSNWQVSLGSPIISPVTPYFPGSLGSTRSASSRAAIAEARAVLAHKQPKEPIFVSNLGPAIVDLDGGSSTQFAGGFVPRAVVAFRNAVQRAVKGIID